MAEQSGPHYVPALRKGLELLELLAEEGPMTLAQVERASGLNRTMSYRLLRVMGELGYVEHDPTRHQYEVGLRLLGLGAMAASRMNLATVAGPFLDAVRAETNETVTLGVLAGKQVVYLEMRDGPHGSDMAIRFRGRDAAHSTSVGKAILAFLPEEVRENRVASLSPMPSVTPSTIIDAVALEGDLLRTRERGYALEDEENAIGERGVGVPVLDAQGLPIAALGIAGPIDRIDLARADLTAARLWRASRAMSRQMEHAPAVIAS